MKQKQTESNTELTKFMTIGMTEDAMCGVRISPNMDAATAYQLLGTLALHVMKAYYTVATTTLEVNRNSGDTPKSQKLTAKELEAAKEGIKESMYDAMNSVFSNVLAQFYPEAPRTTLEDEAILELTNKKIEQKYYAMPPKEREKYKQHYESIKTMLRQDSQAMKDSQDEQDSENINNEVEQ